MKSPLKVLFICKLLLISYVADAQKKLSPDHYTFSVFTNSTAMPFSGKLGIIHTPFHPGASAGLEWNYKEQKFSNPRNRFYQTARASYFYQRLAQHGFQLISEFGYQKGLGRAFNIHAQLGAGYFHSFPATHVFKMNENGEYEMKFRWGRPQFMPTMTIGVGYMFKSNKPFSLPKYFFVDYQPWFQMPFVNKYVPILPNAALHMGIKFNPHKIKNDISW